jgi:hypothetical protein
MESCNCVFRFYAVYTQLCWLTTRTRVQFNCASQTKLEPTITLISGSTSTLISTLISGSTSTLISTLISGSTSTLISGSTSTLISGSTSTLISGSTIDDPASTLISGSTIDNLVL